MMKGCYNHDDISNYNHNITYNHDDISNYNHNDYTSSRCSIRVSDIRRHRCFRGYNSDPIPVKIASVQKDATDSLTLRGNIGRRGSWSSAKYVRETLPNRKNIFGALFRHLSC
jgi:hypothetical protein